MNIVSVLSSCWCVHGMWVYCDMSSTSVKWRKQSGDQTFWSCYSGIVCPLHQDQVLQVLVVFVPHRMKTSIPALLFLGMQYQGSIVEEARHAISRLMMRQQVTVQTKDHFFPEGRASSLGCCIVFA